MWLFITLRNLGAEIILSLGYNNRYCTAVQCITAVLNQVRPAANEQVPDNDNGCFIYFLLYINVYADFITNVQPLPYNCQQYSA